MAPVGLIPVFRLWRFAAVGGAMVLVGALSLLLPAGPEGGGASPRGALVGLGCALVLWLGVLPPLVSNWRRVGGDPAELTPEQPPVQQLLFWEVGKWACC